MMNRTRSLSPESLPESIAVFPLPGAILLPGGQLPLNIFEPRYLNLVEDALSGTRIIGMIQPVHESSEHLIADGVTLYNVGCAGKISTFKETGDGRYLITLDGIIRFRIAEELEPKDGYRRIRADYTAYLQDMAFSSIPDDEQTIVRRQLIAAMTRYFQINGIEADPSSIESVSDTLLVNTLAMTCPLDPGEKQALLECENTEQRAILLTRMFEISAYATNATHSDIRQ